VVDKHGKNEEAMETSMKHFRPIAHAAALPAWSALQHQWRSHEVPMASPIHTFTTTT